MSKGILVVSFGTSYKETRQKTIEACENTIQNAYPDYKVYRAFTSGMVIRRIQKQEGIHINNVTEALEQMKKDGIKEVYVQPLHVIAGGEYKKLAHQSYRFKNEFEKLVIGKPLLSSYEDFEKVKNVLMDLYTFEGATTVLMGHGSEHHAFTAYAALDHMLQDTQLRIASVESYPSIELVEKSLKKNHVQHVHLAPFMLVAGDHATNDMAGDDEDSWYTYLTSKGYEVSVHLVGLGEYEQIQDMYLAHLAEII